MMKRYQNGFSILLLFAFTLMKLSEGTEIESWMQEMLDSVNEERRKESLDPLCYNAKIIAAAVAHNEDMSDNDFFSHTGSDGSQPWNRIADQGYSWKSAAENIASGQTSVASVMEAWMNSPGHRANILSAGNVHFGAAWNSETRKWTQKFANSFGDEECVQADSPVTPTASPNTSPSVTTSPSTSPTVKKSKKKSRKPKKKKNKKPKEKKNKRPRKRKNRKPKNN